MANASRSTGTCTGCGDRFPLRPDGTIEDHLRQDIPGLPWMRHTCPGAEQPAKEQS